MQDGSRFAWSTRIICLRAFRRSTKLWRATKWRIPRFSTTLFSIFAGVGLLLAASGITGWLRMLWRGLCRSSAFEWRWARRAGMCWGLVVGLTARLTIAGVAIGLGCSFALSRVIANYVSGWKANDPVAFVGVTATLLVAALLASWIPARRAVAIRPVSALRHE